MERFIDRRRKIFAEGEPVNVSPIVRRSPTKRSSFDENIRSGLGTTRVPRNSCRRANNTVRLYPARNRRKRLVNARLEFNSGRIGVPGRGNCILEGRKKKKPRKLKSRPDASTTTFEKVSVAVRIHREIHCWRVFVHRRYSILVSRVPK